MIKGDQYSRTLFFFRTKAMVSDFTVDYLDSPLFLKRQFRRGRVGVKNEKAVRESENRNSSTISIPILFSRARMYTLVPRIETSKLVLPYGIRETKQ